MEWAATHVDELLLDWELASTRKPLNRIDPLRQTARVMLRVRTVTPLSGRSVRLTLTDGSVVVRDLTDLLNGPVFEPTAADDALFRRVHAQDGTVVWPGDVDIAPETLIWDGPDPKPAEVRRPAASLRPQIPRY